MEKLKNIFNNKSFQKTLMVGAIIVGATGLLSGAWLAAAGDPGSVAGLVGGAVTLGIGSFGLHALNRIAP